MRILKKILGFVILLAAVLAAIAYLLPRHVHVERALVIEAPRSTVFALVNGFRRFNEWSPWAADDPDAKYAWEGPVYGVGARMSWTGDPEKVGSGSQEILESVPWETVRTKLVFGGQGDAVARFTLAPEGSGVKVVWGFDTDLGLNPIARYFGVLFDRMLGPYYERGLAGLKRVAEAMPKTDFSDAVIEPVDAVPATVAYVATSSPRDDKAIAAAIGGAYAQVTRFITASGLKQAAPPLTINTRWDDSGYGFEAAIPIDRLPATAPAANAAVRIKTTYEGRALRAVHKGAYRDMPGTYDKLFAFQKAYGFESNGFPWDEYVSDPGRTSEADLITHVYLPVK
ncbi:MAG: SRPBCC family protein [Candidatus Polarisedimenticolia bacterium]